MQIRMAQPGDIPDILRLLSEVAEVHHNIRPDLFRSGVRKYNEAELAALLTDPARPIFLSEANGELLGYCFCIRRSFSGSSTERQELYIDDLCVEEASRRKGVAAALYRYACEYARTQGCAFVTLNVWQGNDGAARFYERMGMTTRSTMLEMKL